MRSARAADFWRHLYAKRFTLRLGSIGYKDVVNIGTGSIDFRGGLSVICGGNGVGKSTLIDVIWGAFDSVSVSSRPLAAARLKGSRLSAIVHQGDQTIALAEASAGVRRDRSAEIPVALVDAAEMSAMLVKLYSEESHLDELLESVLSKPLNEKEVRRREYLVGKRYDSVDVYEIEDYAPVGTIPYFTVKSLGAEYGTERMGMGELALFLTLWLLETAPENSIVLLEEPETHVTPRSQIALMNTIAELCTRRSLWAIVTTHSPTIISLVPREHVRLLYRSEGTVGIIVDPSEEKLATALGMPSRKRGVLLVEDLCAKEFATALLRLLNPEMLLQCEVQVAGSDSEITELLRRFPSLDRWFRLVGVFDGDKKGTIGDGLRWPFVFLPGDSAPEQEMIEASRGKSDRLAALLHRDAHEIRMLLGATEGMDHHEWYETLQERLVIRYQELMGHLVSIWIDANGNRSKSEAWHAELVAAIGKE